MTQARAQTALERTLYHFFLFLSAFMILLSLASTLYFDINRERRDMDRVISGAAAYIASMPEVAAMLEDGYPGQEAAAHLDSLSATIPDISVIVICDSRGLRFYHTDRLKTGETFVDGDEAAILAGSEPYISTGYGTKGSQRRAFHAIQGGDGQIIGFVMASVFTSAISARRHVILLVHAAIFLFMIAVSIFLAGASMRLLRKSLRGFDPEELIRLYTRQDEVMNSIDEGLIATDTHGRILFSNQKAAELFSPEGGSLSGRRIRDLYPGSRFECVASAGEAILRRSWSLSGHTVLIDEIPVRDQESRAVRGTLVVIADRTELMRLSDDLFGARSMLDTLRAFNHEFLNKLHVILGYLQTGEISRAIDFISNSTLVTSRSVRETADRIRETRICALVIGKMMHAAELGIRLSVAPDSSCLERDLILPVDACITIIGNLLENAIEELSAGGDGDAAAQAGGPESASPENGGPGKEIILGLYSQPGCFMITCEDTGRGIAPGILPHIYEKGVSSKGENRGTGLFLIRQLVTQYHGDITIDTEPGEGACFTLAFTGKEGADVPGNYH